MKYQVCRPLTPIEYEALKASIAERGVLVPVEVDENGEILDGHHRVRAWQELKEAGAKLADYASIKRTGMSEEQKRNHARQLNLLRRQLSADEQRRMMVDMRQDGASLRQIAQATGVGKSTVERVINNSGVPNGTPVVVTGSDGKIYPAQQQAKTPDTRRFQWEFDTADYERQADQLSEDPDGYDWRDDEPVLTSTVDHRKPHVANNSGNNEWYTPVEYVERARHVLGEIDLDPASSVEANGVVQALTYYTITDDGLSKEWRGRVWMNPPYASDLVGKFTSKLQRHYHNGDVEAAIVLVNNATETLWFQSLAVHASAICFPIKRVKFWSPSGQAGAPLQGQAVLYLGKEMKKFRSTFKDFGILVTVG